MSKRFILLGYIFFVIIVLLLYFYWQSLPIGKENIPKKFIIYQGDGIKEIGQRLKDSGLIKNRVVFQILVYLKGLRKEFWPGEYLVSPTMGVEEIIKKLTQHNSLIQEKIVTFPEGWTSEEMAVYLESLGLVKKEDFLQVVNSPSDFIISQYDFLQDKPLSASLEGYLFPDTYRFYLKTSPEEIVKKMLNNFARRVNPEIIQEIKRQKKTLFEVLILASLVEKEADNEKDRRLIADIFLRRLEKNIPLQSCATINYILKTKKRILSLEEIKTPSPYNTYLHVGLPPGPINNPGLESIKAVIWPEKNDYWFFLSTKEGKTIFSRTKEEHDRNKAIYLK